MNELENTKPIKKASLGRGLGSLLGPAVEQNVSSAMQTSSERTKVEEKIGPEDKRIFMVDVDQVEPNPDQPRKDFEQQPLQELSNSIKFHGIIQPILVRARGAGRFQIIAGERRWRAAQLAGLRQVPVIVKDSSDKISLELALIENIQRQDLNPIEEAMAYEYLLKQHEFTQQNLAEKLGKERATIANSLRLLSLHQEIKDMISMRNLSIGQAKVILSVENEAKRLSLAKKACEQKLTVRELEQIVKGLVDAKEKGGSENIAVPAHRDLEEKLQQHLGTKVKIHSRDGKGKLEIHFQGDEIFNDVLERLFNA